jgi:hypothetical protein
MRAACWTKAEKYISFDQNQIQYMYVGFGIYDFDNTVHYMLRRAGYHICNYDLLFKIRVITNT